MKQIIIIICLLVLTGCLPQQAPSGQGNENLNQPVLPDVSEDLPVVNLNDISDANLEITELKAVGGYTGIGTATRNFLQGVFTHTVIAKIPDPAAGKFYEGWLVKTSLKLEFFSTGKMFQQDNTYEIRYTDTQDHPGFDQVVITEETEANGLDGKPEAHVLEGEF